jgi:hypothetical protein
LPAEDERLVELCPVDRDLAAPTFNGVAADTDDTLEWSLWLVAGARSMKTRAS